MQIEKQADGFILPVNSTSAEDQKLVIISYWKGSDKIMYSNQNRNTAYSGFRLYFEHRFHFKF